MPGSYGKSNNLLLSLPAQTFIRFQAHSTSKHGGSEYVSHVNKELAGRGYQICQRYRLSCAGTRAATAMKGETTETWHGRQGRATVLTKSLQNNEYKSWCSVRGKFTAKAVVWVAEDGLRCGKRAVVPLGGDAEEELDGSFLHSQSSPEPNSF